MKSATTKAKRNGAAAAMTWDLAWSRYTAAVRSEDSAKLEEAKAGVRSWHEQHGAPIPGWAW